MLFSVYLFIHFGSGWQGVFFKMKWLLKNLILATSMIATGVLAASPPSVQNNNKLKAQISKITLQTQELQKEVKELKTELHRSEKKAKKRAKQRQKALVVSSKSESQAHYGKAPYNLPHPYHETWGIFRHPVTVTTSPYMGVRSAFDASDLLEQQSTWNEDLTLLQQRSKLATLFKKQGYDINRPIVEISGGVEGGALFSAGYSGQNSSVFLGTAELDINAIASNWASAYFSLDFDSSPAETGSRVPNSRIYLRRGFLTLGNFNVTPIYFTIGQLYPPFGRYASAMITAPLTLSLARVLARAAILGLYTHGFYAQIYGYNGSQTTVNSVVFNQGGGNIGYKYSSNSFGIDFGSGVISNIADSEGMQNNGIPQTSGVFSGFGQPGSIVLVGLLPNPPSTFTVDNLNNLRNRVPAADAHVEASLGPITIIGEYIASIRRFNPADMTFNGVGGEPKAMHAEIDYLFHIHDRPVTIGAAYGKTWQAYAFNLPEQSIWAVLVTSIWKDTIESIEYRHDINYPEGTNATGGTVSPPIGPVIQPIVPTSNGGSRNIITAQLGVYF